MLPKNNISGTFIMVDQRKRNFLKKNSSQITLHRPSVSDYSKFDFEELMQSDFADFSSILSYSD